MSVLLKIRQRFCRHSYRFSQMVTAKAENGDILYMSRCNKCGKANVFRMETSTLDGLIEQDIKEYIKEYTEKKNLGR